MDLSAISYKYLQYCGIKVSRTFLNRRIKSHPDYPALVSFTDTLEELGLEYEAVQAAEGDVEQLGFPFMAGTPKAVNRFEIISSPAYYQDNKEKFLNRWDGVAVKVKPGQKIHSKAHEEFSKKEKRATAHLKIASGIGLIVYLLVALSHFNIPLFLFSFLSIAGIVICTLIALHSLGHSNVITEQLCSTSKSQSCNLVLNSKMAKITGEIGLGDAGLIYFSGLLLLSLFGIIAKTSPGQLSLLLIPSLLAVCLSIFSVWYQWKVVKAWCKMCLMVSGIIWLQLAVVSVALLTEQKNFNTPAETILQFALAFSIASLWWFIKPLLAKRRELESKTIEALKWKRNPDVFLSLLHEQEKADTVLKDNPLFLGSANAPLQFTVVSNPFCRPCALAHRHLDALLDKYPEFVSLSVILSIKDATDMEDRRVVAAGHILQAIEKGKKKRQVLHDWFETMSVEKFLEIYPSSENNGYSPEQILKEYSQWMARYPVPHTPFIYLNGYAIPKQYKTEDIESMIVDLSDKINPSSNRILKGLYEKKIADLSWQ